VSDIKNLLNLTIQGDNTYSILLMMKYGKICEGRLENFNPEKDRMTLTEVRRKILEQTTIFEADDLIQAPYNPDALIMTYVLKLEREVFH